MWPKRSRGVVVGGVIAATLLAALIVFGVGSLRISEAEVRARIEAAMAPVEQKAMAHQELIATCMERRGFTYAPELPAEVLLEREIAIAEALGRTPDLQRIEDGLPPGANERHLATLADGQREAWEDSLFGTADLLGCQEATSRQGWQASPARPYLGDSVERQVDERVYSDPRFIAAMEVFRECMRRQGVYHAITRTGTSVFDSVGELYPGPDASRAELDRFSEELSRVSAAFQECEPLLAVESPIREEYRALLRPKPTGRVQ